MARRAWTIFLSFLSAVAVAGCVSQADRPVENPGEGTDQSAPADPAEGHEFGDGFSDVYMPWHIQARLDDRSPSLGESVDVVFDIRQAMGSREPRNVTLRFDEGPLFEPSSAAARWWNGTVPPGETVVHSVTLRAVADGFGALFFEAEAFAGAIPFLVAPQGSALMERVQLMGSWPPFDSRGGSIERGSFSVWALLAYPYGEPVNLSIEVAAPEGLRLAEMRNATVGGNATARTGTADELWTWQESGGLRYAFEAGPKRSNTPGLQVWGEAAGTHELRVTIEGLGERIETRQVIIVQ